MNSKHNRPTCARPGPCYANPTGGIFAKIASTPGILNATGARLKDGHYLVRVVSTKFEAEKRSGESYIIEVECVDGIEQPANANAVRTDQKGRKFSSVPKVKNAEVTVRELAEFISAAEGRPGGFRAYINDAGVTNVEALNGDIARAFHNGGTGPYVGMLVFVRAVETTSKANYQFTKHSWEPATEAQARAYGYEWPTGTAPAGAPLPPPVNRPPAPAPIAPVAPAPLPIAPAPIAPPALVPVAPAPLPPPVAPPAPLPIAPAPIAPVQVAPSLFPPGFVPPAGWVPSTKYPGWVCSPTDENPVKFWNPTTNQVQG